MSTENNDGLYKTMFSLFVHDLGHRLSAIGALTDNIRFLKKQNRLNDSEVDLILDQISKNVKEANSISKKFMSDLSDLPVKKDS